MGKQSRCHWHARPMCGPSWGHEPDIRFIIGLAPTIDPIRSVWLHVGPHLSDNWARWASIFL